MKPYAHGGTRPQNFGWHARRTVEYAVACACVAVLVPAIFAIAAVLTAAVIAIKLTGTAGGQAAQAWARATERGCAPDGAARHFCLQDLPPGDRARFRSELRRLLAEVEQQAARTDRETQGEGN